ncbi:hypothetical protein H4R34_000501 [Dimargaris verticillata]|uniref:S-adenosyl-L-methionine-dependent methyltransferase n=1 Tax=Dimargaris verticillata TaxID=2761393 RepID=A0A9W8BBP4_9FUNG|nr:hypothetical protein H4R34_000501 [Dimargaris verticillata]
MWYEPLIDRGYMPDFIIRQGIRRLLASRLSELYSNDEEANVAYKREFVRNLYSAPIAVDTDKANEQHYELPLEFMELFMAGHVKYSSGYYPNGPTGLDEAEERMLESYCQKAGLTDGQTILDLGCGWGSLVFYLAKKYPSSQITGFSNSASQCNYINRQTKALGLANVSAVTGDITDFDWDKPRRFDRIITIEMIEHMKNYDQLFRKLSNWLNASGLLFVEIICHKSLPYHFDTKDANSWMAQNFFTGGCMPSRDLYFYFQRDLVILDHWYLNGVHFHHTAEDWLRRLTTHRDRAVKVLGRFYCPPDVDPDGHEAQIIGEKWFSRWRVYLMSCAEMFAFGNYQEWGVAHYLMGKHDASALDSAPPSQKELHY